MRLLSFTSLLLALVAFILYKITLSKLEKRRQNAEAKRRNCAACPVLPKKDLLGISRFRESLRATRAERGPKYVIEQMDAMGKSIHTVQVRVLDYELNVTRDPENARACFSSQSADFDIGVHRTQSWKPLLGVGIFTSQGEQWRHSRALVRPQFSKEQVSDLDLAERHTRDLIAKIQPRNDGWTETMQLQPLFYNFALDTVTEFLYGYSVHAQNPARRSKLPTVTGMNEPNLEELGANFDKGKRWIEERGAFYKWYWLLTSKDFEHRCKEIHKLVDWFVQTRLQRGEGVKDPELGDGSGRKKFVLLNELAKETQNPLELRNESLSLLFAGRDTAGALLGWCFYFLARHPRVYDKLRSIILQQFGSSATSPISFAQLKACQYMSHVINEVFRVAAVIPLNERVAVRDTTLPRGGGPDGSLPIFIPKGRQVLITTYAMQHRADLWGDDVEDFRPERWEEGRKVGWEFIPFGGGPRACLGQTSYVLVRFLQRFDKLENMEEPGPVRLHHAIENRSGSGVVVRLHEAGK
ncbi:MAG: hypothetical protein Q9217_002168 [Psora testacea]